MAAEGGEGKDEGRAKEARERARDLSARILALEEPSPSSIHYDKAPQMKKCKNIEGPTDRIFVSFMAPQNASPEKGKEENVERRSEKRFHGK